MLRKIISLILCFSFSLTQSGFAQGVAELNLGQYLGQMPSNLATDKFRPVHLRYFSYDNLNNSYKILLDKGDFDKGLSPQGTVPDEERLKETAKELMDYFLIGVTLPNDTFWVNLRPDAPDNIIDPLLERTDIGKVFLEADLQLKKDTASWTSPQTPEGKAYWDKLYKKAGELFGSENITIPTLTRPWIVPNEIIVRETDDSAYVYKATLKVLLEEDYLKNSNQKPEYRNQVYSFSDSRLKELNEYSTQLIRETIIPKLTKEVNSSQRYAKLRQVYYSLILSRWFKSKCRDGSFKGRAILKNRPFNERIVPALIDTGDLTNLTSKENWDKTTYFNQYKDSFNKGEYNIKEPTFTTYGQSIRSYMSGGFDMTFTYTTKGVGDPVAGFKSVSNSPVIFALLGENGGKVKLYNNNFKKVELPKQPLAIAASPLITDNKLSEALKGNLSVEAIEKIIQGKEALLDKNTNQWVIRQDTNISIGGEVYKLFKVSQYLYTAKSYKGKDVKYRTIELFKDEQSKDPVLQIEVYSNGEISALTAGALSDNERLNLYDAVIKNFLFGDSEEKDVAASLLEEDTSDLNSLSTEELYAKIYTIRDELDRLESLIRPLRPSYRELGLKISKGYKKLEEVLEKIAWREDFLQLPQITESSELKKGDIVVYIGTSEGKRNVEYRALRAPIASGWFNEGYVLRKIGSSIDKGFKAGSPLTLEQFRKDLGGIQDSLKELNKILSALSKNGYNSKIQNISNPLSKVINAVRIMKIEIDALGQQEEIPIVDILSDLSSLKNDLSLINSAIESLVVSNKSEVRVNIKVNLDSLLTGIVDALSEVKELYSKLKNSSSALVAQIQQEAFPSFTQKRGGLDFTDKIMQDATKFERMGSFADLKMVLPELSNVEAIDLDNEYTQIQAMASSGIRPSDMRILEFITACYYRQEFTQRLSEITACLKEAHTLDEREGRESSETLRLATVLPDVLYANSLN